MCVITACLSRQQSASTIQVGLYCRSVDTAVLNILTLCQYWRLNEYCRDLTVLRGSLNLTVAALWKTTLTSSVRSLGEVTEVWRFGQLTWEKTLRIVSLAKQYQAFCWSCLAVLCFFEDRKAINKHNLETGCNKGFLPLTSIPVHANTIRLHWEENICLDPTHCLSLRGILSTWDSKY